MSGPWHALTAAALAWLAIFFGRTLAPGKMPLIERIARASEPQLKPALVRYTRLLTLAWCAYFVAGAVLSLALYSVRFPLGLCFALGSAAFFVGEHRLRPHIFPGERFPGLAQQVRDTFRAWH